MHVEFELWNSNSIYVSSKCDIEEHPRLFLNNVLFREPKVLSVLGFHFNTHLTWTQSYDRFFSAMVQAEVRMFLTDFVQRV